MDNGVEIYEVFLNFCGNDTRKGFTNVLYTRLQDVRVHTFIDSERLHVGETIQFELVDRIQASKISIPVFSRNYASSKWCLLELQHMVQMARCAECRIGDRHIPISDCRNCNKRNCGHKIIPIFYDVTPDDVKLKTDVYKQFFVQHESKHRSETVQQWRAALKDVGGLKGLELAIETDGNEGELATLVVNKVWQKLQKSEVQLPEILVGMEHHREKLKGFLNLSTSRVRILGIHGMGGVGKTTIAKVIYNELCKCYTFCCFLEDFERKSLKDPNYLVRLQRQLISIFSRSFSAICDAEKGKEVINRLIEKRKFLLVLDDIDKRSQFEDFFGNCNLAASESGSMIIVTTRNMEALNFFKKKYAGDSVFEIYEPSLMNDKQSLTLFSKFAFNSDLPSEDSAIISSKIVSFASGLPLALKHTAELLSANLVECEAVLQEIEKNPHENVSKSLKRSIKTLNGGQRDIFLDTACLFIGHDSIITSYMWEACGFNPKLNVNVIVMRSLIKVEDADSLWMHPQLRDIGREIVRNEHRDARKRSRLWIREEALDVFDKRMGTKNVLAICLCFLKEELESRLDSLSREDFDKLRNLQFLIAGSVDFEGDFLHLFTNLRWLQWKPLGITSPTNFELKRLVILDLSDSEIADDWNGWIQIKNSVNLKVLILSKCVNLKLAPDLSTFKFLERLVLASCHSLCSIELSTLNLKGLRHLNLSECRNLRQSFDFSQLCNLEYLDVHSCTELTSLEGFESLNRLKYLDTSSCPKLEILPNLSYLQELKTLRSAMCKKLTGILDLHELISLEHLDISRCVNVRNVPNISNLIFLKEVFISNCIINAADVNGIWKLESVETLDLSWSRFEGHMEEQVLDLSNLKKLKRLNLAGFGNYSQIQGLDFLECLEQLNISKCRTLRNLPDLSKLTKLRELKAHMCQNLSEIRGLERLESLELLVIALCTSLQPLPDLPNTRIVKDFH